MKLDLSIFMPAIRTKNWQKIYESILVSCKKYSFELVMVGPFGIPEELKKYENIKHFQDFGSPSRCAQLAAIMSKGRLLYHCVDDAIFLEDSIDQAIDFYYKNCFKRDVVNMRFTEGPNYLGQSLPVEYWQAHYHDSLKLLAGIPHGYKISLHHLLDSEYFRRVGGYDCTFEYQNFNLHDLMFRIQSDGGRIYDSTVEICKCDHGQADHKPIEEAYYECDYPLFTKIYSSPDQNILNSRIKIDINNWLVQQPPIWKRRFNIVVPKDYSDIMPKDKEYTETINENVVNKEMIRSV